MSARELPAMPIASHGVAGKWVVRVSSSANASSVSDIVGLHSAVPRGVSKLDTAVRSAGINSWSEPEQKVLMIRA